MFSYKKRRILESFSESLESFPRVFALKEGLVWFPRVFVLKEGLVWFPRGFTLKNIGGL